MFDENFINVALASPPHTGCANLKCVAFSVPFRSLTMLEITLEQADLA